MTIYAGIEAGGTKFVCGIGSAERGSIATARVDTQDPERTFAEVAKFFAGHADKGIAAAGIASFGPVDLDRASSSYGHILATPKPGWQQADLAGRVAAMLDVPVMLDTDVNAAAIAEARARPGKAGQDLAYVTIGTGIGAGLVVGGRPVHGAAHPEMGHILVRKHAAHRDFAGACPYHGDCLEGLASGTAIRAAWGAGLDRLPQDHPAWEAEVDYLAQLCVTLILTTASATIVLGGGVMGQQALFPRIQARTAALLAGYVAHCDAEDLATRIVPPALSEPPGLIGAYILASRAIADKR